MKNLVKGTKVKMLNKSAVVLASMIGDFEPNQVGVIEDFAHNDFTGHPWYNVSFGDGIVETVPLEWFEVLEEDSVKLDKDNAKKLSEITGDKFKEGNKVELPENDGVELTIKYDGDILSINGEDVDLSELYENEHWMIMNTVDTLYRLLGINID